MGPDQWPTKVYPSQGCHAAKWSASGYLIDRMAKKHAVCLIPGLPENVRPPTKGSIDGIAVKRRLGHITNVRGFDLDRVHCMPANSAQGFDGFDCLREGSQLRRVVPARIGT
jgi:hypothetical protein